MKYRVVSVLKDNRPRFLIISDIEEIEILPSKYLKHLDQINASPNTVKSAAFALSYYYNYLQEQTIGLDEITLLSYSEQNKHFIDFLYWVKSGKHTEHNTQTSNKTCNMYLGAVFRYYQFLALEDVLPMLKVLRVKKVSYFDSMGVNHQNAVNSFKGFFKEEEPNLEEITSEEIQELINACTNDRDRLLIAMMAETGLRLGEILGIHYTEDIDFERRTVRVRYRESNTNLARAKNAEYRMALLSNTTFEFLVKYISDNRKSLMNSEYLFTKLTGKNKGEPLDADSVYSMLKRLSKKTDINSHPHQLRHYFAEERRKEGWDLNDMTIIGRTIKDGDVISIVRKYLVSGIMIDDEYEDSIVGTPQGGNLSPLLANIMLNELDKEMEKRGLNFVRYADDCIIMVRSEMSANRVMRNISRFIEEKLGLKVNMTKSKVDRPQGLKYLGFGFYFDSRAHQFKAKPHAKSVAKFKKRMKELTCRSWGVSNSYKVEKLNQLIRGWINYFEIGSMKTLCKELDARIRYRLRMCIWKQWKTPQNRIKNLMKLGVDKDIAWITAYTGSRIAYVCQRRVMNFAINKERLIQFGLVSMIDYYTKRCVTC